MVLTYQILPVANLLQPHPLYLHSPTKPIVSPGVKTAFGSNGPSAAMGRWNMGTVILVGGWPTPIYYGKIKHIWNHQPVLNHKIFQLEFTFRSFGDYYMILLSLPGLIGLPGNGTTHQALRFLASSGANLETLWDLVSGVKGFCDVQTRSKPGHNINPNPKKDHYDPACLVRAMSTGGNLTNKKNRVAGKARIGIIPSP